MGEGQHSVHSGDALETVAALVAHADLHRQHRVGPCPGCRAAVAEKCLPGRRRRSSSTCTLAGCTGDECCSASEQ